MSVQLKFVDIGLNANIAPLQMQPPVHDVSHHGSRLWKECYIVIVFSCPWDASRPVLINKENCPADVVSAG